MKPTPPNEQNWNEEWKKYTDAPYYKPNISVISHIAQCFSSLKGKKILELGAGSGCDIVELALKGADVYGIDFAEESVKVMKYWAKQKKVSIHVQKGDITQLHYPKRFFDVVYSVGVMEHFINPMRLLRDQISLIRPGGFLVVDVPQTFTLYTIMKHIRMAKGTHPFGWETQYSYFDMKKLGGKLGVPLYNIYGRDFDIANRAPNIIAPFVRSFYHHVIEKTALAPYFSLCIGGIFQIPNYETK